LKATSAAATPPAARRSSALLRVLLLPVVPVVARAGNFEIQFAVLLSNKNPVEFT
jgi:hypothetical protein